MTFRRFFRSPNFDGWYRLRHKEMTQKVECLHLEAICAAVSMILDLVVSSHTVILLCANKECLKDLLTQKWQSNHQVVPNPFEFFFCLTQKEKFWGIELVALFHAITLNVNWDFEASKRMQNHHKKNHKSIVTVVYITNTTVQNLWAFFFFCKEIQQGWIKLIKSDNENI